MEDLQKSFETLQQEYREVFNSTAEEIITLCENLRPDGVRGDILEVYENNSAGYLWQNDFLNELEIRLKNTVKELNEQISDERTKYNCAGCGVCCRFAVSEFSPDELKIKAQKGDNYAKQFTSVFVPYASIEEVKKIYPEYVEFLEKSAIGKYYFYHCPKVTEDNRCPDYENRPQICRDFPEVSNVFLPKYCGYSGWKLKSQSVSLKLRAEIEIINFYRNKIKGLKNR